MVNPLNEISRAEDVISSAISVAATKKEFIGKQIINAILLFIILAVFGCLDFAKLSFHVDYLLDPSFWGTVFSKTVAGVCAFNIGINIMWEVELKKDKILEFAIKLYNHLLSYKDDDFEYFIVHVFNPTEKKKAYVSQINKKIYRLNRFSKDYDRLLYSSELPERQAEKETNRYCIRRTELENLKKPEFIEKNLDALKVKYWEVDPAVFELEIDGSQTFTGVKTKGNVNAGKIKASTNVVLGMVGFSMFISAIGLELDGQEFANQMESFWHYCMKCVSDVGIILWQTMRGMFKARSIISSEFTQPYNGRNKVLKDYYKWRFENNKIDEQEYREIIDYKDEVEVTLTAEQLKKLTEKKVDLTKEV